MAATAAGYFATDGYLGSPVIGVRAQLVRRLLGHPERLRILDVGCGDGTIAGQFLPSNEVTFADPSPLMLEHAQRAYPAGRFLPLPLAELEGAFDVVLCLGVLAHLPDPYGAVGRLAELVSPGGRLLLQFSDDRLLLNRLLYRYYQARGHHPLAPVGFRNLVDCAYGHGLCPAGSVRYGLPLPGTGRLPFNEWLQRRQRFGLERLVLFSRL